MEIGAITGHIDVAQVALYVFWLFFAGLLFYLQRETRREGYPLISEHTGRERITGIFMPSPKVFRTAGGRTVMAPDPATADKRPLAARQLAGGPGSPYVPTGNPLADCIGPSSYAERPDIPDVTFEGKPRIVPMRVATDFHIADGDPDPRGMAVFGADGVKAGTISDVWVDRSEFIVRYLEAQLTSGVTVMMPIHFADINGSARIIKVGALLADQMGGVPQLKSPSQITFLEEEKVMGYYGGGLLYAKPDRQEPLL